MVKTASRTTRTSGYGRWVRQAHQGTCVAARLSPTDCGQSRSCGPTAKCVQGSGWFLRVEIPFATPTSMKTTEQTCCFPRIAASRSSSFPCPVAQDRFQLPSELRSGGKQLFRNRLNLVVASIGESRGRSSKCNRFRNFMETGFLMGYCGD